MSDIIKIKGARLVYPSIYELFKVDGHEPRYATNSKYKPVINCNDYETLLKAYSIAKARNFHVNNIFKDVKVDLELRLFDWQHDGNYGKGASIMKIWVDEQDLLAAAVLSH